MAIDLSLDDHQLHFQEAVADFLGRRSPLDAVRQLEEDPAGYSPALWREMAELGWLGITIPEAYGGTGGTVLDLYPFYEELGRGVVPGPYLDTLVVAAGLLAAAGSDTQKQRLLPAIAAGRHLAALALTEPHGAFGPAGVACSATPDGGGYLLAGTKLLVPYANTVHSFLWAARTGGGRGAGGISVFLLDAGTPGLSLEPLPTMTGVPLYAVSCDGVRAGADAVVGGVGTGWAPLSAAVHAAAVLQSATIVGAARAVLEMTSRYAKDRVQFGRPIGSYQAVQYMVTDVLLDLHRADLLAKHAAFRIAAGRPSAREAAAAAAFTKRACAHLHRQAHEVHAGVAFMLEHDLTLYSRRAKFWENHMGDARYYEEQLATAMGI